MAEQSGQFRVYRVVESVPQYNLQAVESPTLYTVYSSGYGERQPEIDALRTGDRIEAVLAGDPAADDEPWRVTDLDRLDRVEMGFGTDVRPPDVARELWTPGRTEPAYAVLRDGDEAVGGCFVQPRDPLPNGAFVPNVLTGLLPLEPHLRGIPEVGSEAAEALFFDPDPPDTSSYTEPYGVILLFAEAGRALADRFRDEYGIPRGEDTRPAFDPYGL
ncbi:hypothetical protein [Natronomonas sp.]|uniref:hypothetical protein n=1 Tax=Natronomonas sp. TaxID=2184060 RepID=UPI00262AFBDA|nr:hypothetical protein [Natronomonas sp.]